MMLGAGYLFHLVEDCQTILRAKGKYRQVKVYSRKGPLKTHLYAALGSTFIRLGPGGHTSDPNTCWDGIDDPNQLIEVGRDRVPTLKGN
jgi:hypothetical protein